MLLAFADDFQAPPVIEYSSQLIQAGGAHENVDAKEIVVLGDDDHRIPSPNHARGC